jgi:hypothetical protein
MAFETLDETQTAKLNAMLEELYAGMGMGGGGGAGGLPTQAEALAMFGDIWKINLVETTDWNRGAGAIEMNYNPSVKEGKIVNQLPLENGGYIVGGQVGCYSPSLNLDGSANPNALLSHMHADHNCDGYDQIRTAPGKGSTSAEHITANHRNGWVRTLGIRGYFLTAPTTINACCMVDWDRSNGSRVVSYGSLWAFRFLNFQ